MLRRSCPALVAVLVLVLAACGGGGSDATSDEDATTTAEATTTTEAPTTTEAAPATADEATVAEVTSRVIELDDLPEGWTELAEAEDYQGKGIAPEDCLNPEDGALNQLPLGAQAAGPTLRAPEVPYFLTTWAATFDTEADASAWAAALDTPEHARCQGEVFEASNQNGLTVRLDADQSNDELIGQGALVATDAYEFLDGDQVVSTMTISAYQVGRTIVTVRIETGPMEQAQADQAQVPVDAAIDAVLGTDAPAGLSGGG